MLINMLKSKIHRATVTEKNLDSEGSISIDEKLLIKSNIAEYEKVQVVNINNGNRFETYVIKAKNGSGTICLNGAAARLAENGDIVVILAYTWVDEHVSKNLQPKIIHVDSKNNPV